MLSGAEASGGVVGSAPEGVRLPVSRCCSDAEPGRGSWCGTDAARWQKVAEGVDFFGFRALKRLDVVFARQLPDAPVKLQFEQPGKHLGRRMLACELFHNLVQLQGFIML